MPLDNIFDSTSESEVEQRQQHKEPVRDEGLQQMNLNYESQMADDLFANDEPLPNTTEVLAVEETVKTVEEMVKSVEETAAQSEHLHSSENSEESEEEPSEEDSEEEEKTKKKKAAATPRAPNEKVMEARKDFEDALARISNTSGRRRTGDGQSFSDSVEHDDFAMALKGKMELALKRDIQSLSSGKPALERLKLLDQVLQALNRRNVQEILIENGILTLLRFWLEPLKTPSSCTLPSASFRKPILDALKTLPIETAHLRESGLGRIVYFFSKREGELADIRKLAAELVDQWSRPIIAGIQHAGADEKEGYESDGVASGQSTPKLLESEDFKRHVSPSPAAAASTLSVYQKLTSGKRTNRRK